MAEITGAPVPIWLGKEEYLLSPLTDKDIAALDNWIRARHIQIARSSFTEETTPVERTEILTIAMQQAASLTWMGPSGAKIMSTLDGVSRVVYQGLLKKHPEITHAKVMSLLFDPEVVKQATEAFKKLNLDGIREDKPKGDPKAETSQTPKSGSTRSSSKRSGTRRTK